MSPSLCGVYHKRKEVSAAMINDGTQIVLLDEWSENRLEADLAKTVLQSGYMATAVKHGEARTIINRCPFYITTNQVPKFGADDVNVKRRIVVFETKFLSKTDTKAEDWTCRNAIKCIHWIIPETEEHFSETEPEELWYENTATPDTEQQVDYANNTSAVFDLSKVVGLRETILLKPLPENQKKQVVKTMTMIKVISCTKVLCKLQLMRCLKRSRGYLEKNARQQSLLSDMESEYESDNDPRSPSVVSSRNAYKYHKKIFNQLQFSFYRAKLEPCHLYNFRYMQKTSKSTQEGNDEFEAWMLVAGEK